MGGHRDPGPTGAGKTDVSGGLHPRVKKPTPAHKKNQHTAPHPAGKPAAPKTPPNPTKVKRIVVVYDADSSKGQVFAVGQDGSILLSGDVVVGGKDSPTPPGTYHASRWESNHVSTKYGSYANTPWEQSPLGLNAFGPYQLHLKELETRGIYLHGTMGPSWNPFTALNSLLSPTSHGCVRMSNRTDIGLHDLMPHPEGVEVKISTSKADIPPDKGKP
ncbi:MAG TPA: L,D-transpeptidase [Acidobacteriaceae bacterium]|jgi:lipoprotein-anchoring transpeptidase ErfK/SrfK|nr:L,D-transpeptidase [Acidobacteriaceae bacterium]